MKVVLFSKQNVVMNGQFFMLLTLLDQNGNYEISSNK